MKYCFACKSLVEDDVTRCPNCGESFDLNPNGNRSSWAPLPQNEEEDSIEQNLENETTTSGTQWEPVWPDAFD